MVDVLVIVDFVFRNWISTKFNRNEFEVLNNYDRLCCSQEQTGAEGMTNKNQTIERKKTRNGNGDWAPFDLLSNPRTYVDKFSVITLLQVVEHRGIVKISQVRHILCLLVFWWIDLCH